MQNNQRETVIYKPSAFRGWAEQRYERDLKIRQKEGWQLVSCTQSGKNLSGLAILTAIYERSSMPGPVFDLPNLSLLLSTLSPQERSGFDSEVQAVINRWLAMKATQR